MKIYTIQRLSGCSEHEREIRIGDGQRVTIGSSPDADLRLHLSFGLPAVCLEVWHETDRCIAENRTRNPDLVRLNGHPLYSVAQLETGDLLEIGSDSFAVVYLDQTPAAPPVSPEAVPLVPIPDPVPSPRVISTVLKSVRMNDAAVRHEPVDAEWSDMEVLRQLSDQHHAFLFVNFKHARVPLPDQVSIGEDLFEKAPKEIRQMYSLHAIGTASVDSKLQIYEKLRNLDSAVWAIPETNAETSLKDAKIYLAWFARPSVLEMSLQKSPEVFGASLLKPFKAVVLKPAKTHSWVMYCKADFDPLQLNLRERA